MKRILLLTAALAQQGSPGGNFLENWDMDEDGQVSRDEFMARTKDWYAQMDRNGDGILTTADFGRGNN